MRNKRFSIYFDWVVFNVALGLASIMFFGGWNGVMAYAAVVLCVWNVYAITFKMIPKERSILTCSVWLSSVVGIMRGTLVCQAIADGGRLLVETAILFTVGIAGGLYICKKLGLKTGKW